MFETLFGAEMPLAMRFFIAFVIVLALIGAFFWVMRRFGAERLGSAGSRSRQPRLAVIDAAPVDGRRRLVLIRRDNVEHLLMIGGPTDVVVEANIVRAAAAQRDTPAPRGPAPADTRPAPLAEGTMWPLQPEPAPAPAPVRAPRAFEEVQWSAEPEPAPAPPPEVPARARSEALSRLQRNQDTILTGVTAELSARPSPDLGVIRPSPMVERAPERPTPAERILTAERAAAPAPDRASPVERPAPPERPVPERTMERAPMAERVPASERTPTAERATAAAPTPQQPQQPQQPQPAESLPPDADQNLAEMAQRLEAALRRPTPAEPRADSRARPASEPAPAASEAPAAAAGPEARPKPKTLYDSLEQEMASLLGRPAGKP